MEVTARRRLLNAAILTLMLHAAGCGAPSPPVVVPAGAPADFPAEKFRRPAADVVVYEVDPARSLVQVLVYRGGALARMGHDHVVASRDASGLVLRESVGTDRFRFAGDLYAPLAALTVDEDALRAAAGFDTQPSASDREATRGNMLRSLDASRFPFARAAVRTPANLSQHLENVTSAELCLTLHGVTRELTVPVSLEWNSATVTASGSFELRQSDFDIEPFSVLGGALRVEDRIDVSFTIHALRVTPEADATISRRF